MLITFYKYKLLLGHKTEIISEETAGITVKQINIPQGADHGKHLHMKNSRLFSNSIMQKFLIHWDKCKCSQVSELLYF